MTWEEAVRSLRENPEYAQAVLDNYFDLPVDNAARRYHASLEFQEILKILGPSNNRHILDVGAGNGMASWALAKEGWNVTALEPDNSSEVGREAIVEWAEKWAVKLDIVTDVEEIQRDKKALFDVIFCRQVLHHLPRLGPDIASLVKLLKPGGLFLAIREHVADTEDQLQRFLSQHLLHAKYGGENAHPKASYLESLEKAGLTTLRIWGPWDSILNSHPMTEEARQVVLQKEIKRRFPNFGRFFASNKWALERMARHLSEKDQSPGRLYSFLARKSP